MRSIILSLFLLFANAAAAQAPPPVPALPDSARITSYNISTSTCACSVGFQIYASGTDVDEWIQVYVNGVAKLSTDPTFGWSLSSVTGSLGSIPRPITNAVLTFNAAQTATVVIVGDERPRRLSQFPENRGVAARDLNQAITDAVAVQRELWDKSNRSITGQPGEVFPTLPPAASRPNTFLCFDSNGLPIVCQNVSGSGGSITLPGSSVNGDSVCFNGTTGASFSDCNWKITGTPSAGMVPSGAGTAGSAVWAGNCINFQAFGGVGNGVTANDSAWTAIVAALGANGGCIYFPTGKYLFNSPASFTYPNTSPYSLTIAGAGIDGTKLYWPSGNGLTINYANAVGQSAHIRDLSFTTGVPGTGTNTALTVAYSGTTSNPATMGPSDIRNVAMRGDDGQLQTNYWGIGTTLTSVSIFTVTNLNYFGPALSGSPLQGHGTGLVLQSTVTAFGALFNVISSSFFSCNSGISYGNFIQGVTVSAGNFTQCQNGIVNPLAAPNGLSQLSVALSQFAPTQGGVGILINNAIGGLQVIGNEFILAATGSAGVQSTQLAQLGSISGNTFGCPGSPAGSAGIVASAQFKTVITGNFFTSCTNGILLASGETDAYIVGNNFDGSTISNSGSSNYISDNPGYNPVGVINSTTVGTSPATVCAGPSPETHYYSQSATNTATVKLVNTSGPLIGTMTSGATVVADLGPNECTFVTWATTAPTYAKSVH